MNKPDNCNTCNFYNKCKNRDGVDYSYGGLECTEILKGIKIQNKDIMFSKENAKIMIDTCISQSLANREYLIEDFYTSMLNNGYIHKSEIEIIIDETEKIYHAYFEVLKNNSVVKLTNNQLCNLRDSFRALANKYLELLK